jgi:hypothetical protein
METSIFAAGAFLTSSRICIFTFPTLERRSSLWKESFSPSRNETETVPPYLSAENHWRIPFLGAGRIRQVADITHVALFKGSLQLERRGAGKVANVRNRFQTVAIEVCLSFNLVVISNFNVFSFLLSKVQSLGDVPMNR